MVDIMMVESARCPNCKREISEKTLVERKDDRRYCGSPSMRTVANSSALTAMARATTKMKIEIPLINSIKFAVAHYLRSA